MKPTKNRIYCNDCRRPKMLFETEKKAENFIKFNKEEMQATTGIVPQRTYFCAFCGGWHVTSIKQKLDVYKNEQLLEQYLKEKEKEKSTKNQGTIANKKISETEKEILRNKKKEELENQLKEMEAHKRKSFFEEYINALNIEIEPLINATSKEDKAKLRDLRKDLQMVYIVRKAAKHW